MGQQSLERGRNGFGLALEIHARQIVRIEKSAANGRLAEQGFDRAPAVEPFNVVAERPG
jgi:hypothetical protein